MWKMFDTNACPRSITTISIDLLTRDDQGLTLEGVGSPAPRYPPTTPRDTVNLTARTPDRLEISLPQMMRSLIFSIACKDTNENWVGFFSKLRGARSRLYRRRFHEVNTRWKALAEIYTTYSFAPFFKLKISAKNRQHFFAIEYRISDFKF